MSTAIGIDLGTTRCTVGIFEGGRSAALLQGKGIMVLPAAVGIDAEGRVVVAVLHDLARDLGVAEVTDRHRQAVLDAWQQGTQRGVVGSPHFFTPNGAFFCPALDISRVDGHLRIRAKAGMFDEFLHAAFG